MTKYMIAIDGSEHSEKAYSIAHKLLTAEDQIYLITVAKAKEIEAAQQLLAKWENQCKADGYAHVETVLLEASDAREAICEAVEAKGVDILVVGTRGLGTIKRMFIGSVSNYCVQHAPCDVIVAK